MYIIDNFHEIVSASKSCAPTHLQQIHMEVSRRMEVTILRVWNQQCHVCAFRSVGMTSFRGPPVDLISWSHCFQLKHALDHLS